MATTTRSKVKSQRKLINPIFYRQTKDQDDKHLNKDVIKTVRQTGKLKLSGLHLVTVPSKIFKIYELTEENALNVDFNRPTREDELWWNLTPLTLLDLSSNVLTNVPGDISMFQDLTVLNLQDNNLACLPKEVTTLTKLIKLNLSHNKVNTLPDNIGDLCELKTLQLSYNCLDIVPKSLVDLVMLQKLDLSNNNIQKLPTGMGFLVRLCELNVSNNKLVKLPPDIVNMRSLTKLDVSHNSIKHLPKMGELRHLQLLYAQHNDIEEIPDFNGCEQLLEIYFGNNFIKELPGHFCENMIHLKILELRDNQITSIPSEVISMAHITKLDLTNNELTEVPNTIALLPHLQSFKLEGNKLKQIRTDIIHSGTTRILQHLREKLKIEDIPIASIGGMSKLEFSENVTFPDRYAMRNGNMLNLALRNLSSVPDTVFEEAKAVNVTTVDLCKNNFTEVPKGLQVLEDFLTELNLSNNVIREIPSFLSQFGKLKFLDLGSNQLETLPSSLDCMVYLRELVLSNNRFSSVPECVYKMVGLEILFLNDNSIKEIDVNGLQNLTRLATLNVSNNSIGQVPPQLGNMSHIRSLELRGNSFRQPRYAILEQGTEAILSYLRDKIPTK